MQSNILSIQISSEDVIKILKCYQRVTILKKTFQPVGKQAVWCSITPFENNILSWSKEYGIFASVGNNPSTEQSKVFPAVQGQCYPYKDGIFLDPVLHSKRNEYSVLNKDSKNINCGMTQSYQVNGAEYRGIPINSNVLFSNEKASFLVTELITVFLSTYKQGELIQPFSGFISEDSIVGPRLNIDFTINNDQTIRYDNIKGQFVMGSLSEIKI